MKLPARPALFRAPATKREAATCYPLRGTPVHYEAPTEPVAESDWGASE